MVGGISSARDKNFTRYPWEGLKFLIITIFLTFIGLYIAQFIFKINLVSPLLLIMAILVVITIILYGIFNKIPFTIGAETKPVRTNYWILFIVGIIGVIALLVFYGPLSEILDVTASVQQLSSMIGLG